MSKEWFPLIDEDKCIGCLACYSIHSCLNDRLLQFNR